MYIAQAFKGLHEWWRYLLGLVIVLLAWQVVGGAPFLVAIMIKVVARGGDISNLNQTQVLSILEPNLNLFFMLLMFVFGLFALFFVVKKIHVLPLLKLTTTRLKVDWSRFWFIFILWGFISVSLFGIEYYMTPEHYVLNFNLIPFVILCIIAVLLIPIQTSFEEYLFRGYLMQGIGVIVKNKYIPLIITSLTFGLLHLFNPEVDKLGPVIMVYYIGTGLFLGIITLMDEGLELALGFHAANNLFTALLVTADWTALQTHSVFKDVGDPEVMKLTEIMVPVFVVFPVLIFILAKKYNWTNWNDKLFGTVKNTMIDDTTLH